MKRALPEEVAVEIPLDGRDDEEALRSLVASKLRVAPSSLPPLEVLKRSLDARAGRTRFHVLVGLGTAASRGDLGGARPREVTDKPEVIIVGDGPAGLFCAYQLARHGVGAVVVDRGKRVQPRRVDLRGLNQNGAVDVDSNYCFGEGGAGTYSDGKLYTRAHKRGNVRDVIELLALHGAPASILTEARPHIGSNRLPKVVTAIRERLEGVGVEFKFGARVTGLLVDATGTRARACGVRLADGSELSARYVVVATGHSARDAHAWLAAAGARLEAKPFALGVRIEHPQPLINAIQYGRDAGHPKLPNAAYRVATTVEGRGVFSFCMCPGGWVVPASTEPGALVVNGMSLAKRDSPFANSGFVVAVELHDLAAAGHQGVRAGVAYQELVERAAFEAGGGGLRAPATRVTDFVAGRASTTLPASSYIPGVVPSDLRDVLDAGGLPIAEKLREALTRFDKSLKGYLTEEAVLIGVESRTSSPVRVVRAPDTLESPEVAGLYPAGEGAGYAGGIISAAIDGIRIADAIASSR